MKKTHIILCAALAILGICSCSRIEQNRIKKEALGYINAMSNYDFEEARKYAAQETQDVTINYFQNVLDPMMTPADKENLKKNTPATIEIIKISQTSDTTAEVEYYKTTPLQPKHQDPTLKMVKRDERWQAYVVIEPYRFAQPDTTKYDSIASTINRYQNTENLKPSKEVPKPHFPSK